MALELTMRVIRNLAFQIGYTLYSDGSLETNFNIGVNIGGSSNPFDFFGSGTLDQWPPEWPRGSDGFSEKFGWKTQPPPQQEQFPEKIGLGPKGVESRPEFDPSKVPSNASRSSRIFGAEFSVVSLA
jgi:hypothetical protein